MGTRGRRSENRRLPERERRSDDRIVRLRRAVDERDETIRLLNEALSRALDELGLAGRAA